MSRIKLDYCSGSRATYDRFCKAHPEVDIPFRKWWEIISTFNGLYRDYIIETGEDVKFCGGIGPISIRKRKNQRIINAKSIGKTFIGLSCDWIKTMKLGKPIYHLNAHSDGYNYVWNWEREPSRGIPLPNLWRFVACRSAKRGLAAFAKQANSPAKHIYKERIRAMRRMHSKV